MHWTKERPTKPGFYFVDVRGFTLSAFDSAVGVAYVHCYEGVWLIGRGGLRVDDPRVKAFAGPLPLPKPAWIAPPVGSRIIFDGEECAVTSSSEKQAYARLPSGEVVYLGPASEAEGRWHRVRSCYDCVHCLTVEKDNCFGGKVGQHHCSAPCPMWVHGSANDEVSIIEDATHDATMAKDCSLFMRKEA